MAALPTLSCLMALTSFAAAALAPAAAAQSVHRDGFEPYRCDSPFIAPIGWTVRVESWSQAWTPPLGSPVPTFPQSPATPVPIGAQKGEILVVPFTMPADTILTLRWDTAAAQPGYSPRPADAMHIAISPCPADLRPLQQDSTDPFLTDRCREFAATDTILMTDFEATACVLEPGKQYYMSLSPTNPNDGLIVGEHTCAQVANSQFGCDVEATHRGD